MSKPKELFWVDMKLSGTRIPWAHQRAGIRGGKRSSLRACLDSKETILKADPGATVKIYKTETNWEEVSE